MLIHILHTTVVGNLWSLLALKGVFSTTFPGLANVRRKPLSSYKTTMVLRKKLFLIEWI